MSRLRLYKTRVLKHYVKIKHYLRHENKVRYHGSSSADQRASQMRWRHVYNFFSLQLNSENQKTWLLDCPYIGPVMRKVFPCHDVIMTKLCIYSMANTLHLPRPYHSKLDSFPSLPLGSRNCPDHLFTKIDVDWSHDDVIKWKHFPRSWPFVRGIHRPPVNSPHKGQWRGALMFSLICVWINGWVNNREAGDLRRHRGHYDVIVMTGIFQINKKSHVAMCREGF